jgi:arsenite methyltransferase
MNHFSLLKMARYPDHPSLVFLLYNIRGLDPEQEFVLPLRVLPEMKSVQKKPDYGIDAPRIGLAIIIVWIVSLVLGFFLRTSQSEIARSIASIIFSLAPTGLVLIILIILYVKVEKFRHRDRMLNMISWKGDEQVLDIGTGKGLLLIGSAKRLRTGKSFGIDIWNKADLSNNTLESALRNAELEKVRDKVEIKNADVRQIPFDDHFFDYVLSNLCLHNIESREERAGACREITRVLKPGGTALISDFMYTKEYEKEFRQLGLKTSRSFSFLIAPVILHIVQAKK